MALSQEVVNDYKRGLRDLNINKPLINMMTMLAEDHEQEATEIVAVIEDHITKCKPEKKLPVLYLIDSIMKNLEKTSYKSLFIRNIVQTFTTVFEQVDEKTRASMYKLRQTWSTVLPNQKLYLIDMKIKKQLDPAWPITATPEKASIHVNPKFLHGQSSESDRSSPEAQDFPEMDTDPERLEAKMRQELIAKQQELLKLQQARLELELAEAEEQLKQKKKQSHKAADLPLPSEADMMPLAETSPTLRDPRQKTVKDPQAPTDPRLRDPRLKKSDVPKPTSTYNAYQPSAAPTTDPIVSEMSTITSAATEMSSYNGIPPAMNMAMMGMASSANMYNPEMMQQQLGQIPYSAAGSIYQMSNPGQDVMYMQQGQWQGPGVVPPHVYPGQPHGGHTFTGEVFNMDNMAKFSDDNDSDSSLLEQNNARKPQHNRHDKNRRDPRMTKDKDPRLNIRDPRRQTPVSHNSPVTSNDIPPSRQTRPTLAKDPRGRRDSPKEVSSQLSATSSRLEKDTQGRASKSSSRECVPSPRKSSSSDQQSEYRGKPRTVSKEREHKTDHKPIQHDRNVWADAKFRDDQEAERRKKDEPSRNESHSSKIGEKKGGSKGTGTRELERASAKSPKPHSTKEGPKKSTSDRDVAEKGTAKKSGSKTNSPTEKIQSTKSKKSEVATAIATKKPSTKSSPTETAKRGSQTRTKAQKVEAKSKVKTEPKDSVDPRSDPMDNIDDRKLKGSEAEKRTRVPQSEDESQVKKKIKLEPQHALHVSAALKKLEQQALIQDYPVSDMDVDPEQSEAIDEDISDLFGGEDEDYRSTQKLPLKSPSSKGWDQYKAGKDEYAYDIELKRQRQDSVVEEQPMKDDDVDMEEDIDFRVGPPVPVQRQRSGSDSQPALQRQTSGPQGSGAPPVQRQGSGQDQTKIPKELALEQHGNILLEAYKQLQEGNISSGEYQDVMKQLGELVRIQQQLTAAENAPPAEPQLGEPTGPPARLDTDMQKAPQKNEGFVIKPEREREVRSPDRPLGHFRIPKKTQVKRDSPPEPEETRDRELAGRYPTSTDRRHDLYPDNDCSLHSSSYDRSDRPDPSIEIPDYMGPSVHGMDQDLPQNRNNSNARDDWGDPRDDWEAPSDRRPPGEARRGLLGDRPAALLGDRPGPDADMRGARDDIRGPHIDRRPHPDDRQGSPEKMRRPPLDNRGVPLDDDFRRHPDDRRGPVDDYRGPPDDRMGPVDDIRRSLDDDMRGAPSGPPDMRMPPRDLGGPAMDVAPDMRGPPMDRPPAPPFQQRGPPMDMRGPQDSMFDPRGPSRDSRGPPMDRHGAPDDMRSPPYDMRSPPDSMVGPSFDSRGPPRDMDRRRPPMDVDGPPDAMRSPPFDDRGQSFDPRDRSMDNRGPSDNMRGPPIDIQQRPDSLAEPPFDSRGPPMDRRGPPDHMRGPPMDMQGPPDNMRSPQYDDRGPSFDQRGPPMDGPPDTRGPQGNRRAPPMHDQGPSGDMGFMGPFDPRGPQIERRRRPQDDWCAPSDKKPGRPEDPDRFNDNRRRPGRRYGRNRDEDEKFDHDDKRGTRPGDNRRDRRTRGETRVQDDKEADVDGRQREDRKSPVDEKVKDPQAIKEEEQESKDSPIDVKDIKTEDKDESEVTVDKETEKKKKPVKRRKSEEEEIDPETGLPPWNSANAKKKNVNKSKAPAKSKSRESREREIREKETRDRENKEKKERENKEREIRDRERRERRQKERNERNERNRRADGRGVEERLKGLAQADITPMGQPIPPPLHGDDQHGPGMQRQNRRDGRPMDRQKRQFQGREPMQNEPPMRHPNMRQPPMGQMDFEDKFGDARFRCFANLGPQVSEEVIIGRRNFEIKLGAPPRRIRWNQTYIEVFADPSMRGIVLGGNLVYKFGERVKEVTVHGVTEKIFYLGRPLSLWFDGQHYEVRVDSPPKAICINGKNHRIQIDGRDMMILVDKNEKGKYGGEPRFVFVDEERMELRFDPPPRTILIDGKLCELKLNMQQPCVNIQGVLHGIRFDGPPRDVVIDGKMYKIYTDHAVKLRIGNKFHYVSLGGPCHELIVDGRWFEVKFNEQPQEISFGNAGMMVRLPGPPPDVKILPPIVPPVAPVPGVPGPAGQIPGGPLPPGLIPGGPMPGAPIQGGPMPPGGPMQPGQMPGGPLPNMAMEGPMRPLMVGGLQAPPLGGPPMGQPMISLPGGPPLNMPAGMPTPATAPLVMTNMPPPLIPGLQPPAGAPAAAEQPPSGIAGVLSSLFGPRQPSPAAPPVPSGPIDIGSLLDKLVTSGIIKKEAEVKKAEPDAPTVTDEPEVATFVKKADMVFAEVPDMSDFDTVALKSLHVGAIEQLYHGVQCTSCGERFDVEDQKSEIYKNHLDWHFRQNKKDKADMKVTHCRKWFYGIDDWVQYEDVVEEEDTGKSSFFEQQQQQSAGGMSTPTNAHSHLALLTMPDGSPVIRCPAATGNEGDDMCNICHEPFEQYWDEELEEWHLREAIKVNNKTYHPICYEDHTDVSEGTPSPSVLSSNVSEPSFLSRKALTYEESSQDGQAFEERQISTDDSTAASDTPQAMDAESNTSTSNTQESKTITNTYTTAKVKTEPTEIGSDDIGNKDDGSETSDKVGEVTIKQEPVAVKQEPMEVTPETSEATGIVSDNTISYIMPKSEIKTEPYSTSTDVPSEDMELEIPDIIPFFASAPPNTIPGFDVPDDTAQDSEPMETESESTKSAITETKPADDAIPVTEITIPTPEIISAPSISAIPATTDSAEPENTTIATETTEEVTHEVEDSNTNTMKPEVAVIAGSNADLTTDKEIAAPEKEVVVSENKDENKELVENKEEADQDKEVEEEEEGEEEEVSDEEGDKEVEGVVEESEEIAETVDNVKSVDNATKPLNITIQQAEHSLHQGEQDQSHPIQTIQSLASSIPTTLANQEIDHLVPPVIYPESSSQQQLSPTSYSRLSQINLRVREEPVNISTEVLEIGSNASTPTRDELPSPEDSLL